MSGKLGGGIIGSTVVLYTIGSRVHPILGGLLTMGGGFYGATIGGKFGKQFDNPNAGQLGIGSELPNSPKI
jgi:hypothetical protein